MDNIKPESTNEHTNDEFMELEVVHDGVTNEINGDSAASQIVNRSTEENEEEEEEDLGTFHTLALLSSLSTSSSASAYPCSSNSSSKSDISSYRQNFLHKKVGTQRIRKRRLKMRRKSYDYGSSARKKIYSRNSEFYHFEKWRRDNYERLRKQRRQIPRRSHQQSRKSRSPTYRDRRSSRERDSVSEYYGRRYQSHGNGYFRQRLNKLSVVDRVGDEVKVSDRYMFEQKEVQEQIDKVENTTGITSGCYNSIIVNPLEYLEEIQKTNFLWEGSKKY